MTRVSERFAGAALLLVLLAAVPIGLSRAGDPYHDDCASPEQLLEARRIEGTRRVRERPDRYAPGIFQWTQGSIADPEGEEKLLRYRIIRTFDPASVYSAPSQFFFHYPTPGDPTVLRWVESGSERLPVHWRIETASSAPLLLQYMYVFGGEPVAHPFPAGLAAAPRQLREGTLPVTVFVTYGTDSTSSTEIMRRRSDEWLAAAWRHYDAVCNGSAFENATESSAPAS